MGESASITELTPFGRDMETKREVFEEAVRAIFPMFTKVGTEHHGKYFDIPLRNVVPKPVQKPHPPLWMACSQLPTIERAGRERLRRARLPVRQRRCGACLGACLLQRDHQAAEQARRLRDQPEHGAGLVLHVRQDRRGGARARRRRHLLPVRAALSTAPRRTASVRRPARSTCGTNTTSGSATIRKRRRPRCAAA